MHQKPDWLKVRPPLTDNYERIKKLLKDLRLETVCQEARCPNIDECWGGGTATIMLMGEVCTRGCRFCSVITGRPEQAPDPEEPENVATAVAYLGLKYIVLTSVNRDDLPDQGSNHFAKTVRNLREKDPKLLIEVLTPDFQGNKNCVEQVAAANPHVFAHNVETVERLTPTVRDGRASYRQSLEVLKMAKDYKSSILTKSSIMLGLGEEESEVYQTLSDLRDYSCDVVTLGQYLRPSSERVHLEVSRYVHPKEFKKWEEVAKEMGFLYVASGPLVRSSYKAGEFYLKNYLEKNGNN